MNNIRKVFLFLMAMMLAAFALPGLGADQSQNKTYTFTMSVLSQGMGGGPSQLQAVLNNTSPKMSASTLSAVDLFVNLNWTVSGSVTVTVNGTPSGSVDQTTPGHIRISNLTAVKPADTLVVTFSVTASSCGDAVWGAAVWSGSQVGTGNFFTSQSPAGAGLTTVACDALACGEQNVLPADPSKVSVLRGVYNTDGTFNGCGPVSYFASDTFNNFSTLNPTVTHLRWDQINFATAAFLFTAYYTTAPAAPFPKVGWLYQDGTVATNAGADPNANPGNPVVFIQAPACLSADFPKPYGALTAAVKSLTDKNLKVDTSGGALAPPNPVPAGGFPIVIGTERMQVTAISGSTGTWTVVRGTGGTIAATHAIGDPLASTPLPILPGVSPFDFVTPLPNPPAPYAAGNEAHMCVAGMGVDSGFSFVKYFDFADGWGAGSP